MRIIYEEIANFYDTDIFLVQGKKNFVDSVKQKITIKLFQEGLFERISSIYVQILNDYLTSSQIDIIHILNEKIKNIDLNNINKYLDAYYKLFDEILFKTTYIPQKFTKCFGQSRIFMIQ